MALAAVRSRGKAYTLPGLDLDGRWIADSTAIIEALEQRFPHPALYPPDPAERRRALELEDWFDTTLGPAIRRYMFHEVTNEKASLKELAPAAVGGPLSQFQRLATSVFRPFVQVRYGAAGNDRAKQAGEAVVAALDKLEDELGSAEYLAGDSFSVADLTAASLFYPLVLPPEAPQFLSAPPGSVEDFRAPLEQRRGYRWVEQMFSRHR
jgi:glutathione S-transferase